MTDLHKFVGVGITDDGVSCHLVFRRPDGQDYQIDFDSQSIMKMIETLIQANTGALRRLESAPELSTTFLSDGETIGIDPESGNLILTFQHDDGLEIAHQVDRSRIPKLLEELSRVASFHPPSSDGQLQ